MWFAPLTICSSPGRPISSAAWNVPGGIFAAFSKKLSKKQKKVKK
jgi:hypothetical protein